MSQRRLFPDETTAASADEYRPPAQLGLFSTSLEASARAQRVQQVCEAEAWRFFKVRLAESILFGEAGRDADAMRRGNYALARRLRQFQDEGL